MSILVAVVGLIHSIAEKRPDHWQKWQERLWKCYGALLVVDAIVIVIYALLFTGGQS